MSRVIDGYRSSSRNFFADSPLIGKEIEHSIRQQRPNPARSICSADELPAETDLLIAGPNFDREREIREFLRPKRQIWNNAFERALQIKQVEAASCL